MNETNYMNTLSDNILRLRKEKGLTQDSLAERLNISFQAVSKWETGQSSPDIAMLPQIAEIFRVSIDELFGLNSNKTVAYVPWEDDNVIRGAVYRGRTLLQGSDDLSKFTFTVEGDALCVEAGCSVTCGNVNGDINAGVDVNCGDIKGDINAGVNVNCGNVDGDVNAGVNISCGNVIGDASAGVQLNCNAVEGCTNVGD